jgi:hypothetical protein
MVFCVWKSHSKCSYRLCISSNYQCQSVWSCQGNTFQCGRSFSCNSFSIWISHAGALICVVYGIWRSLSTWRKAIPGAGLKSFTNSIGVSVSAEGLLGPFLNWHFLCPWTVLTCPPGTCPLYSRRQRPRTLITDFSYHYHHLHVAMCCGDAILRLCVTSVKYQHHQVHCKQRLSTFLPFFPSPAKKNRNCGPVLGPQV